MIFRFGKQFLIWTIVILALVAVGLGVGIYFALKEKPQQGAVVANGIECAEIGKNTLKLGGSAVDAAVATLFCEGITCPQSMGLGGGFIATIYTKETKNVDTLIARESAPLAATKDMFKNQSSISGALSVAVPGELRGYWELHQKYGKLPWKTLVQPAIDLCRNGYIVTPYLAKSLKGREKKILENPTFRDIFVNPKTGRVWNQGDIATRPKLAESLELIANLGVGAMYDGGKIGKNLAKDIQDLGGIITEEDFKEYQIRWDKPVSTTFGDGYKLYSTSLPGSGDVLAFVLNLLSEMATDEEPILWHRIIESFKHGYGLRSNLGDIRFVAGIDELVRNMSDIKYAQEIRKLIYDDKTFTDSKYYGANFSTPDNHGTANMAVFAPNGDAVTITSTINDILGSKLRSVSTGIILNDEMDDFSTPGIKNGFGIPPSPANYITPKKMPMSSMCPTIILDKNDNIKLLIGSAGGSKITTSVALVIIRHLIMHEPLEQAVQERRLHHQLIPMKIQYEPGFDEGILNSLKQKGHDLQEVPVGSGFSALTAIGVFDGKSLPVYDSRRKGSSAVLEDF